jgi:hypothetical protein
MGFCFRNYLIYFSSIRMHISLPAVSSTGDATYGADNRTTKEEEQAFRHTAVVAVVDV